MLGIKELFCLLAWTGEGDHRLRWWSGCLSINIYY